MCFPVVMEKVRAAMTSQPVNRRQMLHGAALAGGATFLGGQTAAARQTPVAINASEIYDLTHTLSAAFPLYPGYPAYSETTISTIDDIGSLAKVISACEHNGTHVDAPVHFDRDGDTVDMIPVERLVAPLAIIDISTRAAINPDTTLTVDDILAWEAEHGELPPGAFVALNSGWDARANDPARYLNIDASGTLHSPGWSGDAAAFLLEERDITGVGTDTITLDAAEDFDFPAHLTLLPAGKFGVECLANLGDVPSAGATIIIGAPKHAGGSGGQARVIALA